jgi:hypothetical protein
MHAQESECAAVEAEIQRQMADYGRLKARLMQQVCFGEWGLARWGCGKPAWGGPPTHTVGPQHMAVPPHPLPPHQLERRSRTAHAWRASRRRCWRGASGCRRRWPRRALRRRPRASALGSCRRRWGMRGGGGGVRGRGVRGGGPGKAEADWQGCARPSTPRRCRPRRPAPTQRTHVRRRSRRRPSTATWRLSSWRPRPGWRTPRPRWGHGAGRLEMGWAGLGRGGLNALGAGCAGSSSTRCWVRAPANHRGLTLNAPDLRSRCARRATRRWRCATRWTRRAAKSGRRTGRTCTVSCAAA